MSVYETEDEGGVLSWTAVEHLVGDICYGGNITEQQDKTALKALLSKYCHTHFRPGHGKVGLVVQFHLTLVYAFGMCHSVEYKCFRVYICLNNMV